MTRKKREILFKPLDPFGIAIATGIVVAWFLCLYFLLQWEISIYSPVLYLGILLQSHLYTGVFITSHDAMHGTVTKNGALNTFFGRLTAMLFAFNSYDQLIHKHHKHHRHVASEEDPDFHESGNFWTWYYNFLKNYITLKQLVLITIAFQILLLAFPIENIILFWVLPSILSTFQLFYFGTYIPHRTGHHSDNKYKSGTLKKNHLRAFLSCYFFGYHYEHHDAPGVPWWRLWQMK